MVRAIILARLANFLDGYSAVSPSVAEAVAAMLSATSLPEIPSRGHGGAGEILALSHLFHHLASTHPMAEKDVLCLINGSPAASALVADAALAGRKRLEMSASVFALAAEGFNVPLSHYAQELGTLWNNSNDAWALDFLRRRLDPGEDARRRPYQAPVSFRVLPRMLGLVHWAVQSASEIAQASLSAVTDNPVIFPPSPNHPIGTAIRTGYEEEARTLTQATLAPGSESGGFGQNDVASPVPLAWRKQERAGILLEAAMAALAPIALRALDVTRRPVPPELVTLADQIRRCIPSGGDVCYGEPTAKLAEQFRGAIYKTARPT